MICLSLHLIASVPFIVSGLQSGDKATVSLSSYQFLATLEVTSDGSFSFENVPAGTHSLKIETSGYNLPQAKTVIVETDGTVKPAKTIELSITKMSKNTAEWIHSWSQDGSVSGYVTTTYINNPPEILFLGKKIVPSDVPSFSYLKEQYNILLADDEKSWTQEYAYRLLETLKTIPCPKYDILSKFTLTDDFLENDIAVKKQDEGYEVRISTAAFYYANPFLVDLEGVRGRFFSKRLHHALVNYCTDFGNDEWRVNEILTQRFGCSIFVDDYESLTVTNEDAACFQSFIPTELVSIINMFEEMPEGFHKIPHLNYLIRRQNGHDHPLYPDAAAVAWPTLENGYIEFMEKAFGGNNQEFETLRLILHEKTHFLWEHSISEEIKKDWIELGGWYEDPNADSGWSTTKDTEFVSAYAHAKNPNEDMAESVAHYIKNPELLQSRALLKYEFIRDRIMNGTRYISKIPDHLTFEVLNLNPDYDYPGKIKRVDVKVEGTPEEDKVVTVEVELSHMEGFQDEASGAYTRITSPSFIDEHGEKHDQYVDLRFSPVDGNGHLLRGTFVMSKYSKSGYWNTGDIVVDDLNGNQRFEGRNDFVFNMYIDNALEDLEAPKYESGSLKYELSDTIYEGHQAQNLRITFKVFDNIGIKTGLVRLGCDVQQYSCDDFYGEYDKETQIFTINVPITEYFKTGDYYVEFISLYDKAGTETSIWFSDSPTQEKRETIFIKTPNPDYSAPELDLNRLIVYAEPTNKEAPDGETLVTIHYYARDDKSGLGYVNYRLKDPQGVLYFEYHYHENFHATFFDGDPTVWKRYTINTVLPRGSVPGIWGLAELTLSDKAWNEKTYNFVETVIFEPDESTSDYVLFCEMVDNNNLSIQLASELEAGYGFTYRIIHEDTGHEIVGELPMQRTRAVSNERSTSIDVSSLSDGKLIIIVSVKDNEGKVVAVRSNTLIKKGIYRLSYMVDGIEYSTDSICSGDVVKLQDVPTKEGYTFSGWSEAPSTMPSNDVVISGTFTVNTYLVTFKIGDEVVAADSLTYGASIVAPEAPEREGHTFNGWGEVADSVPAGDLTYEGSYSVNSYLLTYTVDGETVQADSVAYGTAITALTEPTKEGYTFSGWIGLPETMPANDVTTIGTFTINKYLVTFKIGDEVIASDSLEYMSAIVAPEAPTKEGYTFSGWSEVPETMPAKDVTISGVFTINKYLVTFKIGDEVIASDSLEYMSAIVAPEAPEKEGHTFNGWGEVADSVPASDLTYEGSYSVNSYLLTYMVDGETVQSDSIAYGTAITVLSEPEKEGYTFSGWSEVPETMPAKDVTISGVFTINKYLVTFKIGDEVIAADSLEYGAFILTPEVPEKEGYTFDGWGDVAKEVPAHDVTYEGSYTVNTYNVYYYVGEELVHTAEVAYGEAIPEYVYEPTEEGYTFLGWIGDTYEAMPAHDVTYIANIDDAINNLMIENGQLTIYDLQGRKVLNTENLKGGIYIINGKRVLIK